MFLNIEELEKEVEMFRENMLASNQFIKLMEQLISTIKERQKKVEETEAEIIIQLKQAVETGQIVADNAFKTITNENAAITESYNRSIGEAIKAVKEQQEAVDLTAKDIIKHLNETVTSQNNVIEQTVKAIVSENALLIETCGKLTNEAANTIKETSDTALKSLIAENAAITDVHNKTTANMQNYTENAVTQLIAANSKSLYDSVSNFESVQEKYINQIISTENAVKTLEAELSGKYNAFVSKLENINLEQVLSISQKLNESSKRNFIFLVIGEAIVIAILILVVILLNLR